MPLILIAIFCFVLAACGPSSDSHEYRVKELLSEIENNPEKPWGNQKNPWGNLGKPRKNLWSPYIGGNLFASRQDPPHKTPPQIHV